MKRIACLALLLFVGSTSAFSQSGYWPRGEIDAFITLLEDKAREASAVDDNECYEVLWAAAEGLRSVRANVRWDRNLGPGVTGQWTGRTIRINPNTDSVERTLTHEALHAAGWGGDMHPYIYYVLGRPNQEFGRCTLYLLGKI